MEEAMYLLIEEAPVDYPFEVGRFADRDQAERVRDLLQADSPDVAFMVMTDHEFVEYQYGL